MSARELPLVALAALAACSAFQSTNTQIDRAMLAYQQKDYDGAERVLREADESQTMDPDEECRLRIARGITEWHLAQREEAMKASATRQLRRGFALCRKLSPRVLDSLLRADSEKAATALGVGGGD